MFTSSKIDSTAHGQTPSARLFLAAAVGLVVTVLQACGPADLRDNVETPGPISGPFAVSRFFTPSGFMGDGMGDLERADYLKVDVNEHCMPRPAGARGNCYRFVYEMAKEPRWAGVYWLYPANNWGSVPGRAIGADFKRATFWAAGQYRIVLPSGGGIGASCGDDNGCRLGLSCTGGACVAAGQTIAGERCLVADECAEGLTCVGQRCTSAGTGVLGDGCGFGHDELCARGMLCAVADGQYQCLPQGPGDVQNECQETTDCQTGLTCEDGLCQPATRPGPFNFTVGGVVSTLPGNQYKDEIRALYTPGEGEPQPVLTQGLQQFSIDLSDQGSFSTLLGAFMWAVPFPDQSTAHTPEPYEGDPSKPMVLYFDDLFIE